MDGYPDGTFQPDKPITRAEQAAVLAKLVRREMAVERFAKTELRAQAMSAVFKVSVMQGISSLGSGSGVVVHPLGYAITNHHVVQPYLDLQATYKGDAQVYMEAEFTDGPLRGLHPEFRLIFEDADHDLAVGKLVFPAGVDKEFPWMRLAETEEQPGEPVVVMGAPMGVAGWESHGVVAREEMALQYYTRVQAMIPVTAVINGGNSGGALVRASDGTLLGINSMKVIASGIEGMGFAIHCRDVKSLLDLVGIRQPQ